MGRSDFIICYPQANSVVKLYLDMLISELTVMMCGIGNGGQQSGLLCTQNWTDKSPSLLSSTVAKWWLLIDPYLRSVTENDVFSVGTVNTLNSQLHLMPQITVH